MSTVNFPLIFRREEVINLLTLGKLDLAGDSRDSLTKALNLASGMNYKSINLKFYDPVLETKDLPDCNSLIVAKVLPDKKQIGDYHCAYNRVHVSELGVLNVTVTGYSLVSEVLDQINVIAKTNIQAYEIIDGALPSADVNGKANITLEFSPVSLLYYSGTKILLKSEVVTIPNITQASVGLSLVNNTPDISKPVSTLQAAADATILQAAKDYADSINTGNPGGTGDVEWATVQW